jgi:hypothetical protein
VIITTTVKLKVSGSNHSELLFAAENALSEFFDLPISEIGSKISYELLVYEQQEILDFDDEDLYTAEVTAKVKDDRTRTSPSSSS